MISCETWLFRFRPTPAIRPPGLMVSTLGAPIAVAWSFRRLPTRPKQPGVKGTTTSFTPPAYWKFESSPLQQRVNWWEVRSLQDCIKFSVRRGRIFPELLISATERRPESNAHHLRLAGAEPRNCRESGGPE